MRMYMWMRLARRRSFEDQNQFHPIPSCPFGHCGLDIGEILIYNTIETLNLTYLKMLPKEREILKVYYFFST